MKVVSESRRQVERRQQPDGEWTREGKLSRRMPVRGDGSRPLSGQRMYVRAESIRLSG